MYTVYCIHVLYTVYPIMLLIGNDKKGGGKKGGGKKGGKKGKKETKGTEGPLTLPVI